MEQPNMEEMKKLLDDMNLSYKEEGAPDPERNLIMSFGYTPFSLLVDLKSLETLDADHGVLVQNKDLTQDNGVYVFAILRSGQVGFLVIKPGTVSRAPLVHKAAGDIITAVTGVDLPPLLPFDMIEIVGHVLVNTCMKSIMEACLVEKQYEPLFLKLYLPKFLINVAMYFTGAVKEDGSPMIYEETVNIEPAAIWQGIKKGVERTDETKDTTADHNDKTGKKEAPAL